MLCTYALNAFAEQPNELKVENDGITPMEKFDDTKKDINIKITTHGAVKFMYCIKYCRETQLGEPSGNPTHVQGSILVTQHLMQDKYLWF